MADVRELLADPDFRALPKLEQIKGLSEYDPDFARLPEAEQLKAVGDETVPVSTAGDPGMLGRIRNLLTGTARNIGGLAQATVDVSPGAPRSFLGKVLAHDQPLVPVAETLLPAQPGDNAFVNLTRGMVQGAESMTRPSSLALLGGLGAAGAVGRAATTAYGRTAARLFDVGIDAYFASAAGKNLLQSAPQVAKAYQEKNYPALFQMLGQDAVNALFGTYFGVRGGRKGVELTRTAKAAYNYVKSGRPGEPGAEAAIPKKIGIPAAAEAAAAPKAPAEAAAVPAPPAAPGAPAPPAAAPAITQRQSAALWARKAELGLSDEPFRAVVKQVSGQESTQDLSGPQASQVLDALNKLQPPAAKPGSDWAERATEYARSKDRVNITALEKHFAIPRAQARQIHTGLVHSGVVDRLGRIIPVLPTQPVAAHPVPQGAAAQARVAQVGAQVPPEGLEAPPAAPEAQKPTLYERAEALARKHGKISKVGIRNALMVNQKQADLIMADLIERDVVNPIGRVIPPPKVEEVKAEIPKAPVPEAPKPVVAEPKPVAVEPKPPEAKPVAAPVERFKGSGVAISADLAAKRKGQEGFFALPSGEIVPLDEVAQHATLGAFQGKNLSQVLRQGYVRARGNGLEIHSWDAVKPEVLRAAAEKAGANSPTLFVDLADRSLTYDTGELKAADWNLRKVRPTESFVRTAEELAARRVRTVEAQQPAQVTFTPGKRGEAAVIRGNAEATDLFNLARPVQVKHLPRTVGGMNLAPEAVQEYRDAVYSAVRAKGVTQNQKRGLIRLYDALKRAAATKGTAIYVETGPGEEALLRHETAHTAQRRLGVGTEEGHIDAARFFEDTSAKAVAKKLKGYGYPDDPDVLAAEIGANLAEGESGLETLAVDDAQAGVLAQRYWNAMAERHGKIVFHLPGLSPILEVARRHEPNLASDAGEQPAKGGGSPKAGGPTQEAGLGQPRSEGVPLGRAQAFRKRLGQPSEGNARGIVRERVPAEAGSRTLAARRVGEQKAAPSPARQLVTQAQARLAGKKQAERGSISLRAKADEYGEFPLPRQQTVFADAVDVLIRPSGGVISKQGEAGKMLMYFVNEAADTGDVEAGKRLEKLQDSGVTKLKPAERIQLLDILEGRDRGTAELRAIADQIRGLTDEIGSEAESLGVEILAAGRKVPFVRLENYFPHVIRSMETLASRFSPIRRDVIDNLVRLGIKPYKASARAMLDDYVGWLKDGGRRDSLIQYLMESGQADNRLEATRLLARARKDTTLKHGSLEFAREIDLPLYDPDPARVLPHWVASASERLESIRVFGQKGAKGDLVQNLIESIRDSGGDVNYVEKAVERMLGRINELHKGQRVSAFLRTVQGFKLGLAAIPNATQGALNSLLYGDLQAVGAGFKGILTKEGRRFGARSGASIDTVLNEMVREVGTEWHPLGVYLKAVGFTGTERLNRIFAANAGASYAGRLAKRLRINPHDKTNRARIEELGIDPDQVTGGQLTGDQILKAAKKFSDITQFRSRPQDLPLWASSPAGKVFFQFKTFIYGQTRLVGRTTFGEIKRGNYGRAARNFLILAAVFPLTGEAIGAMRRFFTGQQKEKDQTTLERWWDDIGQVGALGILNDIFESVKYGGGLKWTAGPAPGQVAEITDAALRIPTAKDPWKAAANFGKAVFKHVPLLGQLRRRIGQGMESVGLPNPFPVEKKSTLSPELKRLLAAGATP